MELRYHRHRQLANRAADTVNPGDESGGGERIKALQLVDVRAAAEGASAAGKHYDAQGGIR